MPLKSLNFWGPRLSAFFVAALVAASMTYWVLRWPDVSAADAFLQGVPEAGYTQTSVPPDSQVLARLMGNDRKGATEAAFSGGLASRFVLSGVVAGATGSGAALIAVDGKPVRSYGVGSRVVDGLVLQAVAPRRAMLAEGPHAPASVTLEMKPLAK
jgi:general secretion pathway protein C